MLKRFRKRIGADETAAPAPPADPPLAMLDRLHAGERPDYCLFVRPRSAGVWKGDGILSVNIEQLLPPALDPLPMLMLNEMSGRELPEESFLLLANHSRIVCLAPTSDRHALNRLRQLKSKGPIGRCVFIMPDARTLGEIDWPAVWPEIQTAVAPLGIELSAYTAGGWLFRVDREGKSITFRPIVNPNPEKIARALESICLEM